MAKTEFTITDANIGSVLPIVDGFITDLSLTTPPTVYETPSFNAGRWTSGYLTLRDDDFPRDVFSFQVGNFSPFGRDYVVGGSFGYVGRLEVTSVPKGAVFSITLSDVPVARKVAA